MLTSAVQDEFVRYLGIDPATDRVSGDGSPLDSAVPYNLGAAESAPIAPLTGIEEIKQFTRDALSSSQEVSSAAEIVGTVAANFSP